MKQARKIPQSELLECGHMESPHGDFTRGYGQDNEGNRFCYDCCTQKDKDYMREHGKISLYLVEISKTERDEGKAPYSAKFRITNWPGHIFAFVRRWNKGRHNIAGSRIDVWFPFEGYIWHGVQYGDNTQIVHCKRTKERAFT